MRQPAYHLLTALLVATWIPLAKLIPPKHQLLNEGIYLAWFNTRAPQAMCVALSGAAQPTEWVAGESVARKHQVTSWFLVTNN